MPDCRVERRVQTVLPRPDLAHLDWSLSRTLQGLFHTQLNAVQMLELCSLMVLERRMMNTDAGVTLSGLNTSGLKKPLLMTFDNSLKIKKKKIIR